jgi:hypothetical protein
LLASGYQSRSRQLISFLPKPIQFKNWLEFLESLLVHKIELRTSPGSRDRTKPLAAVSLKRELGVDERLSRNSLTFLTDVLGSTVVLAKRNGIQTKYGYDLYKEGNGGNVDAGDPAKGDFGDAKIIEVFGDVRPT